MIMVAFGLDMKLIKKLGIKEILEFRAYCRNFKRRLHLQRYKPENKN